MNSVKQLYELQLIDSEIQVNRDELDDINNRIGESEEIREQKKKIAGYEDHLSDIRKQKKDLEWDVDELTKTLNKLNLEQDAKMHKGNLEQKEDGLLEIMSDEEETDKRIRGAGGQLKEMEKDWEQSQSLLIEKRGQIEQKLAALYQQRNAAAEGLDSNDLSVYESVRSRRDPAVVRIEQGRCQGCRLNLPMSQIQGARTGKLVQCTSCGRILYIG